MVLFQVREERSMSTVTSNLTKIEFIKEQIHSAIKNKGVDISNDIPFEEYPNEIGKISGGGDNTILKTISTIPNPNVGMCVFSTPTTVLAEETALFESSEFENYPYLGIDYYGMNILPYRGYGESISSIFKLRHNPFTIEKISFSYPEGSEGYFRYFNNIIFYCISNYSLRFDAGNIKNYPYVYLGDENFFYNDSDKTVVRVDLDTGKVLESYTCDGLDISKSVIMNNNILYLSKPLSSYTNDIFRVNEETKSLDRIDEFPLYNVHFRGFTNDKKFLISTIGSSNLCILDVQDPTSPTEIVVENVLPSEFIYFTTYASDIRFNFNPQNNILLAFSINDKSHTNIKACKYINGTWIDYPINVSANDFILQQGNGECLRDCVISGNENILIMVVDPHTSSGRTLVAINLKTNQYWLSAESPSTVLNQYSVSGNIKSINEDNTLSVETLKIPVIKTTITANSNNANITVYGEV